MASRRKRSKKNNNHGVNTKNRNESNLQLRKGISSNGSIEQTLINAVPHVFEFNLPIDKPDKGITETNRANDGAAEVLKSAQLAIVNSYKNSEDNRVRLQLPLIKEIVGFTKWQLLFSNVVILGIIFLCGVKPDLEIVPQLFDFLKWYFAGTVVEFIGFIGYVTKGTFSEKNAENLEKLLNASQKDSDAIIIDEETVDNTYNK